VLAFLAFTKTGLYCWIPLVYLFFLIPLVELVIQPDADNLTEAQEAERAVDLRKKYFLNKPFN
jgi:ABC-type uncharacterized transport system permease subunit